MRRGPPRRVDSVAAPRISLRPGADAAAKQQARAADHARLAMASCAALTSTLTCSISSAFISLKAEVVFTE